MDFTHQNLTTTARTFMDHLEGATALLPGAPEGGYVVGGLVPSIVLAEPDQWLPDVQDAVARILSDLIVTETVAAAQAVGVWRDSDTGLVYVDASSIIADREDALAVARERGELAVWDRVNGREIRTGVREG
ncbi:hypothetical protein [Brevibacterium album]|uniref:hypothetical protein n=1 Tax=Brevibacterium album TaxID=417948 RepID=UPI0004103C1A|nr:hypothetical protein [Brevibacterium album]